MTRTCYDSTTAADVPKGGDLYAGYVDGRYVTVPALRKRFPKARIVTITVLGTPGAHVCDTEPGNIGVAGADRRAKNEIVAGRKPTLYLMASMWPQVKTAVKNAGIAGKVSYWIAQYDGKGEIPKGAVAKQYLHGDKNHPGSYSGGHYDTSIVADYWPGVDPEPAPKPPKVKPLSKWQRALIRRVTQILNKTDDLTTDDRKAVAGLDAAALHALGGKP
jgi:hypothetical protein